MSALLWPYDYFGPEADAKAARIEGELGTEAESLLDVFWLIRYTAAHSAAPDYAAALRHFVQECPNCRDALVESVHADGLHLTCADCGFFATEDYARRRLEGNDGEN